MEKSEQIQPYQWILGIDVSKESIDACLIHQSAPDCTPDYWFTI
jgi:hypothetical protein